MKMKKIAAAFLVLAFLFTGCTGSFKVTREVYKFHRQQKDKWVDELLFLALVIIPVYEFATLGDAIIFNSIEFWTGRNPISGNIGTENTIVKDGNNQADLAYNTANDSIRMKVNKGQPLTLSRSPEGLQATDTTGKIVFTSVEDQYGGVSIYNASGQLIKHISPDAVVKERARILHN